MRHCHTQEVLSFCPPMDFVGPLLEILSFGTPRGTSHLILLGAEMYHPFFRSCMLLLLLMGKTCRHVIWACSLSSYKTFFVRFWLQDGFLSRWVTPAHWAEPPASDPFWNSHTFAPNKNGADGRRFFPSDPIILVLDFMDCWPLRFLRLLPSFDQSLFAKSHIKLSMCLL